MPPQPSGARVLHRQSVWPAHGAPSAYQRCTRRRLWRWLAQQVARRASFPTPRSWGPATDSGTDGGMPSRSSGRTRSIPPFAICTA